ncbi:MAG TPA: ATP-binding protein [Bryobacteraceae bacterium]
MESGTSSALLDSGPLFGSDVWKGALESYASAAHLSIKLFDTQARVAFGPVHPTPLFRLFKESTGYDPGLFADCARRCLSQTQGRPAIIVSTFCGLAVVGTSFVLDGKVVGAAVGGYALVDFAQVSEVQRLALDSHIEFEELWRAVREQKPVPKQRLIVNGELLQVLGDALLRENYRTRQYEQAVLKLEEAARENAQTHRELEQAASELRAMNDDLRQFAFAASHDLREPLRMVTSFSQLLVKKRADQLDSEAARWTGFITEGTERMEKLLSDLLTYIQLAQIEKESAAPVDLNDALEEALNNLRTAMEESGATVSGNALPMIPGQQVHFVELFQNLIGNAIKYRGTAPPRIIISAKKSDGEWRVAVADNGMGIDAEDHQTIFGVFKRLHGREIPGTGIGLAMCQRIVERYGGRIWVESKIGAGATFYFTLPAAGN